MVFNDVGLVASLVCRFSSRMQAEQEAPIKLHASFFVSIVFPAPIRGMRHHGQCCARRACGD